MMIDFVWERVSSRDWWETVIIRAILSLIAALLITLFVIVFWSLWEARDYKRPTEFERRDAMVAECLASERYTRAECVQLVGKGN